MEKIKHTLQLDEDLPLFQKGWKVHIAAWVVFYTLILLAAAGLFGTGPLSHRMTANEVGSIEYERFLRDEAETDIIIRADNIIDSFRLAVPQEYLSYINIEGFTPEPAGAQLVNNAAVYTFPAQGSAQVSMRIKPRKAGALDASITVNNRSFAISHLIYP